MLLYLCGPESTNDLANLCSARNAIGSTYASQTVHSAGGGFGRPGRIQIHRSGRHCGGVVMGCGGSLSRFNCQIFIVIRNGLGKRTAKKLEDYSTYLDIAGLVNSLTSLRPA